MVSEPPTDKLARGATGYNEARWLPVIEHMLPDR